MPYEDHKGFIFSQKAASAFAKGQAAVLSASAPEVVPASFPSAGRFEIFGVTQASALQGENVTVYGRDNIVKVKAGASLGAGAAVAPGIATIGFVPVVGASGIAAHRAGLALEAAAQGESFALYVSPAALGGLA